MEYESSAEARERKQMVARRRHEAQNQLNCEKAFINELANKYDYIKMDRFMKENIKKKLLIDLKTFEPHSYVSNLCVQVETLYIFSILKSLLFSQYLDDNVQKIVQRYRIDEIPQPPAPYYALTSYELKGGPIDKMLFKEDTKTILMQYSLMGRQCYIDTFFKLHELNDFIIEGKLFCHPISYDVMYPILQNDPDYKGITFEQVGKEHFSANFLDKSINNYPVDLSEYVKVWHSISNNFKKVTVQANW